MESQSWWCSLYWILIVYKVINQGVMEVPMFLQCRLNQGDSVTPFTFNSVVDTVLLQLEIMPGY